ncbi:MAG TPA: serine/threonine-protein kinase, partial [Ktedonobacteraceae bacterium]|nr:serine/threonine-protein kinase [Ktedonobacteraceae bacterium]
DEMNRSGSRSSSHVELKLVASYIRQVADALDYAHSLGVVHRDIKPGNLLFHQDGRLLLGDFGIVRLKAMPALTSAGSFLGTAEYASPEQIGANEIDFRSDIYSLGIILFELLTGNVPYTGPNPFAVMARKMRDPLPSIKDMRSDISPAIEAVVTKALAMNPADRYQSASAMADDLRTAIDSGSPLRISGDGNNSDLTVAERPLVAPAPVAAAVPVPGAGRIIPPTQPGIPGIPVPPGGAYYGAWPGEHQHPGQWQWPSQNQAQSPGGFAAPSYQQNGQDQWQLNGAAASAGSADAQHYRERKRLFYHFTFLITLLAQLVVFIFVVTPAKDGAGLFAMFGVMLGCGLNFLILAAIGFSGVARTRENRPIRKFVNRAIIVAIITPLLSGVFISYGSYAAASTGAPHLLAYLILLLSNLYLMRQLGRVDAAKEQVEAAPVLWRPAFAGALTGLLPLTIMMIFALPAFFSYPGNSLPWLDVLGVLFIIALGIPTPGAMMAVWLSAKMSFATLSRSSAIAGMLMFTGAYLLAVLWEMIFSSHSAVFANLNRTWIVLLIIMIVLGLVGALRGMLDAWIFRRFLRKEKTNF